MLPSVQSSASKSSQVLRKKAEKNELLAWYDAWFSTKVKPESFLRLISIFDPSTECSINTDVGETLCFFQCIPSIKKKDHF